MIEATFAGPVDFGRVQVGEDFLADNARFLTTKEEADFNSMKVENSVRLNAATFAGPADFGRAQVGDIFDADDAHFTNTKEEANFNSMKVENSVQLDGATFAGPADFGRAQVGDIFDAGGATFNNAEQEANFNSMKVDGDMFLQSVVFQGPVDFGYAELGFLDASGSEFQYTQDEARFTNMIVDGVAWFDETVFKGPVTFDYSTFLDLLIYGSEKDNHLSSLSLEQTIVHRELRLWWLQIGDLTAESLTVFGPAFLQHTAVSNSANFASSTFAGLTIENVDWPETSESADPEGLHYVDLGGMYYQEIKIIRDEDQDAWRELIDLVDGSRYNAQAYTALESYFREQGYPERANETYVTYKRRERDDALSWASVGKWWNYFLDGFVEYGRSPGRALVWGIVFILLGCIVFRKQENMVSLAKREVLGPTVGNHGTRSRKVPMRINSSPSEVPYNPFWYSLDLFIPFVDLGFDDKWCPKPSRKWVVFYSKVHMLAGWLLIPIGLLAITGVIS